MPGGPWTCPSKPMSLAWHPKTADLVVGLKSGQLHRLSWSSKSLQLPAGRESPVLFLAFPLPWYYFLLTLVLFLAVPHLW